MSPQRVTLLAATALLLMACLVAVGQPTPERAPFFEVLRIEHVRLAEPMPTPEGRRHKKYEDLLVVWGTVPNAQPYLPRAMASDQIMLDDTATLFVRHPLAGPSCAIVVPLEKAGRLSTAELWRLGGHSSGAVAGEELRHARRRAKRAGPTSSVPLEPAVRGGLVQPDLTLLRDARALREYVKSVAEDLERNLDQRRSEEHGGEDEP